MVIRFFLFAISVLSIFGCTTTHTLMDRTSPIDMPPGYSAQLLKVGDEVTVTANDGSVSTVTLTEIADAYFEGRSGTSNGIQRYSVEDIRRLERKEVSGVRTAVLVGAIATGFVLIVKALATGALVGNIQ